MDEGLRDEERRKKCERSIIKTYRRELWGPFTKALNVYKLIEPGDKIAVCVSGGKDSMLLAKLLQELYAHGERNFELSFLAMDPGYSEANMRSVEANARLLGVPIRTFRTEIFDVAASVGGSPCYLCARMRRGYLYSHARELGCNKIALGHHFDDVIETTLMSMLYGGQIQTMPPKLRSRNFPGMELIRPMYLIREADIIRWKNYNGLTFLQCACRLTQGLAGGGAEKGKRAEIKRLIAQLKTVNPQVEASIFRSMENVCLDTAIAYKLGGVRHHFLDDYDTAPLKTGDDPL